jgi:hypothetical protein
MSSLSECLDNLAQEYRGTFSMLSELRMIREISILLKEKAPWAGKRCPVCQLMGHGPGSRECLNRDSIIEKASSEFEL